MADQPIQRLGTCGKCLTPVIDDATRQCPVCGAAEPFHDLIDGLKQLTTQGRMLHAIRLMRTAMEVPMEKAMAILGVLVPGRDLIPRHPAEAWVLELLAEKGHAQVIGFIRQETGWSLRDAMCYADHLRRFRPTTNRTDEPTKSRRCGRPPSAK